VKPLLVNAGVPARIQRKQMQMSTKQGDQKIQLVLGPVTINILKPLVKNAKTIHFTFTKLEGLREFKWMKTSMETYMSCNGLSLTVYRILCQAHLNNGSYTMPGDHDHFKISQYFI
jgi:hypothetical protein